MTRKCTPQKEIEGLPGVTPRLQSQGKALGVVPPTPGLTIEGRLWGCLTFYSNPYPRKNRKPGGTGVLPGVRKAAKGIKMADSNILSHKFLFDEEKSNS
jgi:hypothetical protein